LTISVRAALDTSHAEIEAVRDEPRAALAMARRSPAALAALPPAMWRSPAPAMHQAIAEPRITLRAAPPSIGAGAAAERYRP
jgi:hypothetical protein